MSTVISPNMNLPVPVVGVEPGPEYATDINNSLNIIDAHDHTPGNGVQLTPDSINVNTNLPMNNYSLTGVNSVVFQPGSAASSSNGSLSESGVDLYYTDGNGNQIRITQSGSISGATGSIAGLASPASATYVSGSQTFVWESDTNVPANMDGGSVILRNITASSNGVTLSAPTALSSNYTLTMPQPAPADGTTHLVSISSAGNMSSAVATDNDTLQINTNILEVRPGGISATEIANNTITATQIANATITTTQISASAAIAGTQLAAAANILPSQLNAGGSSGSSSSGSFTTSSATFVQATNMAVIVTGVGRPVFIYFVGDGSGVGSVGCSGMLATGAAVFRVRNSTDNVIVSTVRISEVFSGTSGFTVATKQSPGVLNAVDITGITGSKTYVLEALQEGGTVVQVTNVIMRVVVI